MTSSKPYLFRATVEWIEDNGLTPHIVVDANIPGVIVPTEHVKDGEIVLNVSSNSVKLYTSNNDEFNFNASFSGRYIDVFLPMASIKAVFAKENQQGMFFNERVVPPTENAVAEEPNQVAGESYDDESVPVIDDEKFDQGSRQSKTKKKSASKKASHLKIIK